ncbi:hypothetical protein GGI35DRAFT_435607 [Trichoderma velutinum]
MLLKQKQLGTIVDAWNEKAYADDYIQYAFMTDDPETVTIQNYVDQLGSTVNLIRSRYTPATNTPYFFGLRMPWEGL